MAKLIGIYFLVTLCFALIASTIATTYTVGDSSGWDISSSLDTWTQDKTFVVGDVLAFQYSSTHSVDEVTKRGYDSCNTTDVLNSYTNGNTTVPLTSPGPKYFICGNKLHCYSGMKLLVNVVGNQTAGAPAGAPRGQPGDTTLPSSKSNNPPVLSGASVPGRRGGGGVEWIVKGSVGLVVAVSLMFQV